MTSNFNSSTLTSTRCVLKFSNKREENTLFFQLNSHSHYSTLSRNVLITSSHSSSIANIKNSICFSKKIFSFFIYVCVAFKEERRENVTSLLRSGKCKRELFSVPFFMISFDYLKNSVIEAQRRYTMHVNRTCVLKLVMCKFSKCVWMLNVIENGGKGGNC